MHSLVLEALDATTYPEIKVDLFSHRFQTYMTVRLEHEVGILGF